MTWPKNKIRLVSTFGFQFVFHCLVQGNCVIDWHVKMLVGVGGERSQVEDIGPVVSSSDGDVTVGGDGDVAAEVLADAGLGEPLINLVAEDWAEFTVAFEETGEFTVLDYCIVTDRLIECEV
jgi:hypothetical protein